MNPTLLINTIVSGSILGLMIDNIADQGSIGQVGRLGLDGVLAVGIVVLWRFVRELLVKLDDKDTLIMANYKSMADALATQNATAIKMSETLDKMNDTMDKLSSVRLNLHGDK